MQAADEKKLKRGIMSNKNLLPADDVKGTFSFDELYDNLQNCLACIIEKLKKGNICTFLGAGFSYNANKSYPDWPTLLIDAYKGYNLEKIIFIYSYVCIKQCLI